MKHVYSVGMVVFGVGLVSLVTGWDTGYVQYILGALAGNLFVFSWEKPNQ